MGGLGRCTRWARRVRRGAGALLGWRAADRRAVGRRGAALVAGCGRGCTSRASSGLPVPVPQLRRQVPDWWRTFFPPHVAAFLYGIGLGPGFLTYLRPARSSSCRSPRSRADARWWGGAPRAVRPGARVGARARVRRALAERRRGPGRTPRALGVAGALAGRERPGAAAVSAAMVVEIRTIDGPSRFGELAARRAGADVHRGRGDEARPRSRVAADACGYGLPTARRARRPRGSRRRARRRRPRPARARVDGGARVAPGVGGVLRAIVVGRVRAGRRLECGCFGGSTTRDYRVLLARNLALAGVAFVAWTGAGRVARAVARRARRRRPAPRGPGRARCSRSPPGWGRPRSPAPAGRSPR